MSIRVYYPFLLLSTCAAGAAAEGGLREATLERNAAALNGFAPCKAECVWTSTMPIIQNTSADTLRSVAFENGAIGSSCEE